MRNLSKLTKRQLIQLLEIQEACLKATSDFDDVKRILDMLSDAIPFESAVISFDIQETGIRQSKHVNFGMSEDWLNYYREQNLSSIDPTFARAANVGAAFTYDDSVIGLPDAQEDFRDIARDFGVKAGICCSALETRHDEEFSCLINLSSSHDEFEDLHKEIFEFVMPHISCLLTQQGNLGSIAAQAPSLTSAELEVLKWCREGKTSWEIGVITSRSERTTKFHLANIYKKLGVSSRAHAVAKAIRLGLLA